MTADVRWRLALDPVGERDCVYALSRSTHPGAPVEADVVTEAAVIADALWPPRSDPVRAWWADQWRGPLVEPASEREFAVQLANVLLPDVLRRALLSALASERHRITVSARGWLAQVPWDLAALDEHGEVRLCERATVVSAVAPTALVGRRRRPLRSSRGAALLVVDPGPRSLEPASPKPLYLRSDVPPVWRTDATRRPAGALSPAPTVHPADSQPVTSTRLSELLCGAEYSQFSYFGHVLSSDDQAPAAARLVLADDDNVRTRLTARTWLMAPDSWPMPPHVALIGCGSDDAALLERSGLPMAAINAGARVVTATRWPLPNDDPTDSYDRHGATTSLAIAVTQAQATAHPIEQLHSWQLAQLGRWRRHGGLEYSPLLWGSLVSYVTEER